MGDHFFYSMFGEYIDDMIKSVYFFFAKEKGYLVSDPSFF